MNELKDCPFCFGKANIGPFLVGCPPCKISFPFNPRSKGAMNEAIKKWNKREANA
jgi:hypothetical protein